MPPIRHIWQLTQHGDYAFSIDVQDSYLCICIVKQHCHFLLFVWHNMPYQGKVLPFGLATTARVFMALTTPILFLCHCKGLHIAIYLNILVLVHSKLAGKRAHSFFCSLLVFLWITYKYFHVWPSPHSDFLFFGGVILGYSLYQYLCLLVSEVTFGNWLFPCCRHNLLQAIGSCPY